MRSFLVLSFLMVVHLTAAPSPAAQPETQDLESLRQSLRQIQEQMDRLAASETSESRRVTDLGSQSSPRKVLEDDSTILSLRFYDISDLFGLAPQYPAKAPRDYAPPDNELFQSSPDPYRGGGGMGGGSFSIPDMLPSPGAAPTTLPPLQAVVRGSSVSLDSIVTIIESVISPGQWDEDWSMATVGNGLLVNAPEATHRQIQGLLDLFRKQWGGLRTVLVQAYWVECEPQDFEALLEAPTDGSTGIGLVRDAAWTKFLSEKIAAARVPYSAAVTLHNGQTVNTSSGARPIFINRVTPEFSSSDGEALASVSYDIGLAQVQLGSTLQLTASVTRGGNYVVLDVRNRIYEPAGPSAEIDAAGTALPQRPMERGTSTTPRELAAILERPQLKAFHVSTTVRCPQLRWVFVGGSDPLDPAAAKQGMKLCLFVQAAIHNVIPDENRSAGLDASATSGK